MCAISEKLAFSSRLDDTSLNFRMAVGAEEDAFTGLRSDGVERSSESSVRQTEVFRHAVPVVELKSPDVTVVAA